jgi:UTP--glucose-1-phosphate uridylyltransferase
MIKKAIIPAAGLGTRFLPATKAQPKEMLPIVTKPTIQYIVEEAIASGIEDIIIVTGRNKRAIEDHFDRSIELELKLYEKNAQSLLEMVEQISSMVDIHYIRQKAPLGLGHAIYCARKFIGNEPFAVLLGDDIIDAEVPCLKQMMDVYRENKKSIIGVQKVPTKDLSKYGVVISSELIERISIVEDLIEKPIEVPPSNLAIVGRYILEPGIFNHLARLSPGKNNEIQLTDALRELVSDSGVIAYQFEGKRYDIGDKLDFLKATVELALKDQEIGVEFRQYLYALMK